MRVLGVAAALAAFFGAANAATISISNADFEAGGPLQRGVWEPSADGWTVTGQAGTFAPSLYNFPSFNSPPTELGAYVGFLNAHATMSQLLGETIEAGVNYTLSALFGSRIEVPGAGSFGFYADNAVQVIGTQTVTPGAGEWHHESLTLEAAAMAPFVGQRLGVIFFGSDSQLNIDVVSVMSSDGDNNPIDDENTLINPVPGALPLMLTGLLGGWLASRRRKKRA